MIYYKGQKKHSPSWAQMVKYSTLRTELGLRMRKGKTMKDRQSRKQETANG